MYKISYSNNQRNCKSIILFIYQIVKLPGFKYVNLKQISPIIQLLGNTSNTPPAARQCFDIICEMLCYEYPSVDVYLKLAEILDYYYKLQHLSVEYLFYI